MSFIDSLTPKDTEEIRPGLFVQKRKNGYRILNPIAWDGKYRWKKQFSWRSLFTIVIILFVAFSYFSETKFCRELQENPCELLPNITNYCIGRPIDGMITSGDFTNLEVIDGTDTFTLQDNP